MFEKIFDSLATLCRQTINSVDTIIVYNPEADRLYSIDKDNLLNNDYNASSVVKKASQLKRLGEIQLHGVIDFMLKYPESGLDRYIDAIHTNRVAENFNLYVAAYIHLYHYYKSLPVFVSHGYYNLIDTFIDCCINENTDHPHTICYFPDEIYKIFKLRKAVYNMLKTYLNDHEMFRYVLNMAQTHKYTDKQFRELKKAFKEIEEKEKAKNYPAPITISAIQDEIESVPNAA